LRSVNPRPAFYSHLVGPLRVMMQRDDRLTEVLWSASWLQITGRARIDHLG
jgi:hypothetical protein